jgi:hypothetical protein
MASHDIRDLTFAEIEHVAGGFLAAILEQAAQEAARRQAALNSILGSTYASDAFRPSDLGDAATPRIGA